MGRKRRFIVTIDGPAGAGKSTVSKIVARKLGFVYLDTGALYRALAYKALKLNIPYEDASALDALCSRTSVALKNVNGVVKIYVDQEEVKDKIRTEEIGWVASKISTFPVVRRALLDIQRACGREGGIVAEGRDMGTVVFPDAEYKFFLDASLEERAERRYKELQERGNSASRAMIRDDLLKRDEQDRQRPVAPLRIPDGAVVIQSDHLSVRQVVEKILSHIKMQ